MEILTFGVVHPFRTPPKEALLVIFTEPGRRYIPKELADYVLEEGKRYAKNYGVHLIPELYEDKGMLTCCLISPEGEIVGMSHNQYLNLNHRGRFQRSTDFQVLDTPLGKVALLVDVDIAYPPMARLCSLQGAELIVALSAIEGMDFYPEMVTYKAKATAVTAGVPLIWVTSCGYCGVDASGECSSPFSWALPYYGEVNRATQPLSIQVERKCRDLMERFMLEQKLQGERRGKDGEL